jgi:hypothetical protein
VPSGKLSGPTLNPDRAFFGCDAVASSSRGLLGAMISSLVDEVVVVVIETLILEFSDSDEVKYPT